MLRRWTWAVVVAMVGWSAAAWAEDAFYHVPLAKLKITQGELPREAEATFWMGQRETLMRPRVVLEGVGEAYYAIPGFALPDRAMGPSGLFVRAEAGKDITGRLYMPKADYKGMVALTFTVPASAADPKSQDDFYRAKRDYYERLLGAGIPGAAWFRHEAMAARRMLGDKQTEADRDRPRVWNTDNVDDTYALFSGGRALSENLQLDRALPPHRADQLTNMVKVDTIPGVTVREMDWKPLIKDLSPKTDPLAKLIPADQHAVFFPSFEAYSTMIEEADRAGTPVLHLMESRAEDARTQERYQRQLCLSLTAVGKVMGPRTINSVAMTGSDLYLRTGSDIAILFEAKGPAEALRGLLAAQLAMGQQKNPQAKAVTGEVRGVSYIGVVSADRTVSSYLALVGNAAVVTNSLRQLDRVIATNEGKTASVASLPEYTFFRDRYKLGDADETAFALLSDAAIRRWCGPRWRIADSRRTRAAALLSAAQADHMDGLARGAVKTGPLQSERMDLGEMRMGPAGVSSSIYGTLEFMTPIVELDFDAVTQDEAQAYARWRDSYQQNWSQFFDPIAVRLTLSQEKLAADVSVMPLIGNTEYREFMDVAAGVKLGAAEGDPHDALAHFILAINKNSRTIQRINGQMRILGENVDILGWLGTSVSLYFDDDAYWDTLKLGEDFERMLPQRLTKLPIALRAESTSPIKLAMFLTAARAFIQGAAPQVAAWENRMHQETTYVRIGADPKTRRQNDLPEELALYYVPLPDALVLSLNEDVIKHAIERYQVRNSTTRPAGPATQPWLGSSLCLRVSDKGVQRIAALSGREYNSAMRLRAWGNLPILNEWKRMYPDQDPVQLHEKFWQTRLICPGGGQYAWNAQWQTMESTVYGHPGQPKDGPAFPPALNGVRGADFGVDFENNALRARAALRR